MMGQFHVRIQKNEVNVPSDVPSKLPDLSRISLRLSLTIPTMTDNKRDGCSFCVEKWAEKEQGKGNKVER